MEVYNLEVDSDGSNQIAFTRNTTLTEQLFNVSLVFMWEIDTLESLNENYRKIVCQQEASCKPSLQTRNTATFGPIVGSQDFPRTLPLSL